MRAIHYCGIVPAEDEGVDQTCNAFFESVIPAEERAIIDDVVAEYSNWDFGQLQRLCREPGSSWDTYYDERRGTDIPDSTIRNYYRREMVT